jgi:hyperosmotically inducible protein
MKKPLPAIVFALLVWSPFQALADEYPVSQIEADRTLGQIIDDATITTRIKTALLADNEVNGLRINVDTLDGNVVLTGAAESDAQIHHAGELAAHVEGVQSVDNRISLWKAEDSGPRIVVRAQIEDNAASDKQAGRRTAGEVIDDAWINIRVKATLLRDEKIPGLQINVDTLNKVVTLTGRLGSAEQAQKAVRLATAINGVKSVNDKLQVAGEGAAGRAGTTSEAEAASDKDLTITEKVKAALNADDATSRISVSTQNGVVTLRGEVADPDKAAKAEEVTLNTEGVESVDNQLAVKKIGMKDER